MAKFDKFLRHLKRAWHALSRYWRANWWHKTWLIMAALIILLIATAFGIGQWYKSTQPAQINGVSFEPDYAESLGLDPKETLSALEGIGARHFRLVSYWNNIEPEKGKYDFSQLDWQFASIAKAGGKISLSIGLRQPRWPECHAPSWVDLSRPRSAWQPQLENFMTRVINRYKNNPVLESYQLENEYFNTFGNCHDSSRQRLVSEFNLVKKLDPNHPIILTRSNKYPNLPTGEPRADIFGEEYYHIVWSPPVKGYYIYPLPAWYYSFLAGATKIATGRDSIMTEVQAEPWLPPDKTFQTSTLVQQDQTFDAKTFQNTIDITKKIGLKEAYYWGASYWYYRWKILHDPSVWHVAEKLFWNN